MGKWLPWDNSHYRHDFCLEKSRELKESGQYLRVRIGSTIAEHGEKYSKIYVIRRTD
jgi:hypothetical protein